MTPDEAKSLRKGDVVLVRLKFLDWEIPGVRAHMTSPEGFGYHYVDVQFLSSVEPRPLEVGDGVTTADSTLVGEIRAIEGQDAWVKWPAGDYTSEHIPDLTRADPQPSDKIKEAGE